MAWATMHKHGNDNLPRMEMLATRIIQSKILPRESHSTQIHQDVDDQKMFDYLRELHHLIYLSLDEISSKLIER